MTRWILRRFKHICAKANRKAKRNGHAAVPLLFAQKEPPQGGEKCCGSNMGPPQGGKNSRRGRRKKPRSGKGFNWIVRDCCLCALIRGLQNLEAPLKGFNCCGAKLRLRCADARFAKPRSFLRKERFSYFSRVRKVPKVHQRFANLWTPGTIQSSVEENFSIASGGTSRTRLFVQIGGEKALNRCEVRALQREDLERTTKEWPYSLRTVGYGWVGIGSGGWKRVVLNGDKGRFVQKKSFCA